MDFLCHIGDAIRKEYVNAINFGNWSHSGYIQELYYNYKKKFC